MLSLNKTKSREELSSWLGSQEGILSWKMDGLTIVLTYRNGSLYKAVTRGNGEIGEVITNNAKVFKNVPLSIPYTGELIIRGEAVIRYSDFEKINSSIPDADARYKNPRNLCSGSVRQLDNSITAKRNVYFYAFAFISASDLSFSLHSQRLDYLEEIGFDVVERMKVNAANVVEAVAEFEKKVVTNDFPSDGLVLIFDDIAYGESLGRTAKFPRNGIAFKWADETASTTIREIEWSASRTGLINPVAIFNSVELEGTTVSRASLHNISIMKEMKLGLGDSVTVYKANMIIPQLADNLSQSGQYEFIDTGVSNQNCSVEDKALAFEKESDLYIPIKEKEYKLKINYPGLIAKRCPVCGKETIIHLENDIMTLYCENPDCIAKKIKLFSLMASRDALNIDGLSEATIEKLIGIGLIHKLSDFFRLSDYREQISSMEGFGEKSCTNLLLSIDKARNTSLDRVVYSLGIPNIGLTNAKLICKYVDEEPDKLINLTYDELINIPQIGDVLAASFTEYFANEDNVNEFMSLLSELELTKSAPAGDSLSGLTFVITGSVEHFSNRNELKAFIEGKGGKVTGSVTGNTSFLINNDINSSSSKNKTAKSLGVEIITEDDFLARFGEN